MTSLSFQTFLGVEQKAEGVEVGGTSTGALRDHHGIWAVMWPEQQGAPAHRELLYAQQTR